MAIIFEDLSAHPKEERVGYFDPESDEIHIDINLSSIRKREVLIHEIIESCLHELIKHSIIEILTCKISLGLRILKEQGDR